MVWDYNLPGTPRVLTLTQHTKSVTCVKWGGSGLLYTASQDTTIHVYRVDDGVLCRTLKVCPGRAGKLSGSSAESMPAGPRTLGEQPLAQHGLCASHGRVQRARADWCEGTPVPWRVEPRC